MRNENCVPIYLLLCLIGLYAVSVPTPQGEAADGSSIFVFNPRFYYVEESYFDIINRQAKEKYRERVRKQRRHIRFWGKLGEYERGGGVKVVIPF
ncbi:hypothetical protein LCGC14_1933970 [marine sediment metagenome]|uniref:Uncharacterized protein n=1 Tax=marine sediment metagenome TaxID=412755 RepID=A0A0F9GAL0_9ZZZZ